MLVKRFVVGTSETNLYIVACEDTGEAIVVDPDFKDREGEKILEEITSMDVNVKYIVNTHGHGDHIGGNALMKEATGAQILVHEFDAPLLPEPWRGLEEMFRLDMVPECPKCGGAEASLEVKEAEGKGYLVCSHCDFVLEVKASPPADRLLRDGDVIEMGNMEFEVLHTPGHSRGGISLYSRGEGVVFTGDTLLKGFIGGTDLPFASNEEIMSSLKRLLSLPNDTLVYPGHMETTDIGRERANNPYLPEF